MWEVRGSQRVAKQIALLDKWLLPLRDNTSYVITQGRKAALRPFIVFT